MKILQVSTHFNIGGIGNYILSLSAALQKRGVETIVATSGGNLEKELKKCGIRHIPINLNTKFELGPKVFASSFALSSIVKSERIDVIHAHSRVSQAASLFASRMSGAPYITTCHGYFKVRSRKIFDTWGKKVVAISDAVRTHLMDDLGVEPSRIELIYNGVDIGRFSKAVSAEDITGLKRALGLKGGPVIGTIGRLSPVKGHKFFINAMADVIAKRPDAQGLIVGSGGEEKALKDLAASLGIDDSVIFVPSDPDTHKLFSVMDVFVFPSIQEGLGLALLEALGAGKACVASRVGGISDVIKDGYSGILVDACDPDAISLAVISLLDNRPLRQEMGEHGRAVAKDRFSIELMADKMRGLYKKAMEE